jgi:hypothetical protein
MLEGRPIDNDTLAALERRTWEKNFPELQAAMAAICGNVQGPVNLNALRKNMPYLLPNGGRLPIVLLQNPVLGEGGISGLQQVFQEGVVLIGRVKSMREAEGNDPVIRARIDAIKQIIGTTKPGFFTLPTATQLSRIHCVVGIDGSGLWVHALPNLALPVIASSLSQGGGPTEVRVGQSVGLGMAGQIVVPDRSGNVVLQLFVFAGEAARDQYGQAALAQVPNGQQGETMNGGVAEKLSVWTLNGEEQKALIELILQFDGGMFNRFLKKSLQSRRGEKTWQRLYDYLMESPHPTMYCGRLFSHPPNSAVPTGVAAALKGLPDCQARIEALPKDIAESTMIALRRMGGT